MYFINLKKCYLFPKVTKKGNINVSYHAPKITQNSFQENEFIPIAGELAPSSGILKKKYLLMSTMTQLRLSLWSRPLNPYSVNYTLEPLTAPCLSLMTTFHKSSYFLLTCACFDYNGETQMLEDILSTLIKVLKKVSGFDLGTLKHIL